MDKFNTWKSSEPVRLYAYSVMLPVLAVLVAKGVISASDSALYAAVAAVVLGVPVVEKVRSAVYSPDTVDATMEVAESDYEGEHRA